MRIRTVLAAVLTLGILGSTASTALAQTAGRNTAPRAGVNARQVRQHARIRDGVKDGSLTRAETLRLRREQTALRREEGAYRRSGSGLTRFERRDLQRDLNTTNRQIRRMKHNGRG
jgi:hypothetical protein